MLLTREASLGNFLRFKFPVFHGIIGLLFLNRFFFCSILRKHEICEKKQADLAHRPITRLAFEPLFFFFFHFPLSLFGCWDKVGWKEMKFKFGLWWKGGKSKWNSKFDLRSFIFQESNDFHASNWDSNYEWKCWKKIYLFIGLNLNIGFDLKFTGSLLHKLEALSNWVKRYQLTLLWLICDSMYLFSLT